MVLCFQSHRLCVFREVSGVSIIRGALLLLLDMAPDMA